MSPIPDEVHARAVRFPRVSGDEPTKPMAVAFHKPFSPRERG